MKTSKGPSLFHFACHELSQDAFICWLLSWINYENKDKQLYQCATSLINTFFELHSKEIPKKYDKIEIHRQEFNVDIWCKVNDKYIILIEDKTNTQDHSNQLNRYLKKVKEENIDKEILPIYFKTGDQGDRYKSVDKTDYKKFLRKDFLNILNDGTFNCIENNIFQDYKEHLQNIEDEVNSYKTLPLEKWTWSSWKGFYLELQMSFENAEWDYVAKKSGGFLGFWWNWQGDENFDQKLQLEVPLKPEEQINLCFKIYVKEPTQRSILRQKWYEKIINEAGNYNLKVKKPARFGYGKYMTVAILDEEFRQFDHNGQINMSKTVAVMRRLGKFLESIADEKTALLSERVA